MYATTRGFLDYFNLKSLDQLPALAEIRDLETLNAELGFNQPVAAEEAGAVEPGDPSRPAHGLTVVGGRDYAPEPAADGGDHGPYDGRERSRPRVHRPGQETDEGERCRHVEPMNLCAHFRREIFETDFRHDFPFLRHRLDEI